MAAPDCILHRTLARSRTAKNQRSQVVCRETLYLLDVLRYTRDEGSSVYFPHTIFSGEYAAFFCALLLTSDLKMFPCPGDNLYDVTLSDGDCRLRVTLDPRLNGLVEKNVLRQGTAVRNATLAPAMTGLADRTEDESFIMVSVEVSSFESIEDSHQDSLPWSGSSDVSGPLLANRKVFLPLWNNVDFYGDAWKKTAPPLEEEVTALRPTVTVQDLSRGFLAREVWALRTIRRRLIVRIAAKSHLTYYGRADSNCACPYQALLEAHDSSGSVSLVLWNSMCVNWYRVLKPGHVISLSHFRIKERYQSEGENIEISVNSRNPASRVALLPEASVAPDCMPPPAPPYNFCDSEELASCSHGALCDVIGLLTFMGRAERMKKGSELMEYRWLRLQDGRSSRPIWIQLFSTSQPQVHRGLHPLLVLMCSRLKAVQTADGLLYLTNTAYTQLHRSGNSQLPAIQRFFDWFREQDERRLLRSALIGGFFAYPPPPVSLEAYMRHRQARFPPGDGASERDQETLLQGATHLLYSGHRYHGYILSQRRGGALHLLARCVFVSVLHLTHLAGVVVQAFAIVGSQSVDAPPAAIAHRCQVTAFPAWAFSIKTTTFVFVRSRPCKRKLLLHSDTPQKGRPRATVQPDADNKTAILFEASMEFLQDADDDGEDEAEEDEDSLSYATCPSPPDFPHVAVETLAMRYDPAHEKKQAVAVAMGGSLTCAALFASEDYYTLRLKALSDGVCIGTIFLPQASSSSLSPPSHSHSNTWASILSHGAFSCHAPPPSPGDLIATATLLANQRLLCLLDVCNLGGDLDEVVISRAFPMT
ncbi:RPA-related protein RADX [Hippocampus zosterae]|uniref:RPA-related protein RADX n=1 Tax=Hippocampus zosterae TaxID=109293 RepID=UPI00223D714C|nr:RPA-related protein RADX [Hippocampus zosterae]